MAKDLHMCSLIDTYGAMLTEKQREVLQMYYFEDFSLSEIAELSGGITRQGVRDTIKRGEAVLNELEDALHLAGRFDNLTKYTALILQYAADVKAYGTNCGNAKISSTADEIVKVCEKINDIAREEENGI